MSSKDQRRNRGPDKTTPFTVFQPKKEIKFLPNNLRIDGRSATDMRKMFMSVGVISQAKGSSFIEVGDTKVICGVYGPRELQKTTDFKLKGHVKCEVKMAPFSTAKRKPPQPDREQREISRQIKEAMESVIILDKFPKAQIDVCLTVIEDGGSVLSTCLTAAGLALCHASIDVYELVVGASILWHEGVSYVDPNLHEETCHQMAAASLVENAKGGSGHLYVGMMPTYAQGQVALCVHEGELSAEALCEGLALASEVCSRIYALARQTLINHVEKDIEFEPTENEDNEGDTLH